MHIKVKTFLAITFPRLNDLAKKKTKYPHTKYEHTSHRIFSFFSKHA